MPAIDEFAYSLLETAKRFLEKATEATDVSVQIPNLHAALAIGFCALEAHINAVSDEIAQRPDFSVHERALLLEQEVRLEYGEFKPSGLRMVRLEDRIMFLHLRLSGEQLDRTATWWGELAAAMDTRNKLAHPKEPPIVTIDAVTRALRAIIEGINVVYLAVYGRPFPYAGTGLHSSMNF